MAITVIPQNDNAPVAQPGTASLPGVAMAIPPGRNGGCWRALLLGHDEAEPMPIANAARLRMHG